MPNAPTPAPSVLEGLKQTLRPHPPFAAMGEAELDRLVRASKLAYFAAGETILGPGGEAPPFGYVIRQGAVRGERPGGDANDAALFELAPGEMFPLGALLGRRGVTSVYRAAHDTFCLVFPAAVFDALIAASPVFQDFCTRRLAYLLDLARVRLQAEYAAAASEKRSFVAPLASLPRRPPVVCRPSTPIGEALATMEAHRIGSLPVVDDDSRPLGIFTRQDVIARIVLPQRPLSTPIGEVMSAPALGLPARATAGDAALLMAQQGVRHVVIHDEAGRVSGVVSERDLYALQRLSVRELASDIRRAPDAEALAHCAADVRALSHALVAQGVAATQLTRMISALNDQIAVRILELLAPRFDVGDVELCWLGLGSEGRSEQTIVTDQDNGLVFAVGGQSPESIRERLLPFARAVNEALDRCGFPLCKGGVMAMNPRWCASLDEWKAAFANWIDRGDPDSLLAASIFFDFRAVWGEPRLADELRDDVALRARGNTRFLKQMSDNALKNRPPLSWWGELQAAEDGSGVEGIDLKMNGSVPFVDAARIFALASGVTATGTIDRLEQSAKQRGLPADEARDFCDAFEFVQLLRLREQHRRPAGSEAEGPQANPNRVALARLSDLDRRILTEAMRQIRRIQQRLELDYPG